MNAYTQFRGHPWNLHQSHLDKVFGLSGERAKSKDNLDSD
jgi:hypothetical protein